MHTFALQARTDNECHAVVLGAIRVLVSEQENEWFAQGIEVDYGAGGSSLEDVQGRFQRGLEATVHEHLRRFGTIDRLLKYAPQESRKYLTPRKKFGFNMVTSIELSPNMEGFPFGLLVFLKRQQDNHEASAKG